MSTTSTIEWSWSGRKEGAEKWSFFGTVKVGTYKGFPEGTDIVVKVVKEGFRITEADARASQLAHEYACSFNKSEGLVRDGKPVRLFFRLPKITTADGDKYEDGVRRILKGETMLVEIRIKGEWEKFNSNNGWSLGTHQTPDAFSHWTWVKSDGKHLVCDLQGHRGRAGGPTYEGSDAYYLFTDPVVLSQSGAGVQGPTDLGPEGIKNWFANHRCNDLCRSLGIDRKRPRDGRKIFASARRTSWGGSDEVVEALQALRFGSPRR